MIPRFDTLHKKPTVWSVAVATGIAAALAALSFWSGNLPAANCILTVYLAAVIVLLLRAWRGQLAYNPYSYNTILYMGFALFTCSALAFQIVATVQCFRNPEGSTFHAMLALLLNSAKLHMLLTLPFLLVFSVALFVSNVALIRHEGARFVNFLGILLAVALLGGEVLVYALDYYAYGSETEVMLHDLAVNLIAAGYLYFESMLLGAIVADLIAARHVPDRDKDFLIVLGCGLRRDGTPTPVLRGRLDLALDFAQRQRAERGTEPVFVVSGGQGPDEVCSEAESMRNYLLKKGVPAARIIVEDRSTDTAENMLFSKEKIWVVNPEAKVAFATTNYHVFRAGLKARRVKMRAVGMGTKTRWYFWPNAAVREFVGLLTEHRGKQALVILGIVAFYVALTLLYYRA